MVNPVISLIKLISMFFAFIDFAIEIALFFSPSFIPLLIIETYLPP